MSPRQAAILGRRAKNGFAHAAAHPRAVPWPPLVLPCRLLNHQGEMTEEELDLRCEQFLEVTYDCRWVGRRLGCSCRLGRGLEVREVGCR